MKHESGNNRGVVARLLVVGLGILLPFAGCQTLAEMAPPVGSEFRAVAVRRSVDLVTLELGREVYLTDCARCHSIEPISRYSAERWRKILPRMARETKLDARREAAVEAYVMLAHAFLEQNAKTN